MTHDELLAKIDRPQAVAINVQGMGSIIEVQHLMAFRNALRAVVELHKPIQMRMPHGAIYCMGCGRDHEFNDYWIEYPCETIKTIEKALA